MPCRADGAKDGLVVGEPAGRLQRAHRLAGHDLERLIAADRCHELDGRDLEHPGEGEQLLGGDLPAPPAAGLQVGDNGRGEVDGPSVSAPGGESFHGPPALCAGLPDAPGGDITRTAICHIDNLVIILTIVKVSGSLIWQAVCQDKQRDCRNDNFDQEGAGAVHCLHLIPSVLRRDDGVSALSPAGWSRAAAGSLRAYSARSCASTVPRRWTGRPSEMLRQLGSDRAGLVEKLKGRDSPFLSCPDADEDGVRGSTGLAAQSTPATCWASAARNVSGLVEDCQWRPVFALAAARAFLCSSWCTTRAVPRPQERR